MGVDFTLDEPIGNNFTYTKIERLWNKVHGPFSITRYREVMYSIDSCLTYSPLRYKFTPFSISTEKPTEEWIVENLKLFIRNEFTGKDNSSNLDDEVEEVKNPQIDFAKVYVEDDFLKKFLNGSDNFFKRKRPQKPKNETIESICQNIFELLTNGALCGPENKENNDKEYFINRIKEFIKNKSRLMFIIPAFPFKDQNILRIPYNADEPDLAEVSFLVRLHELSESINQIYPYGSDFIILSDGELYCEIFDIEHSLVEKYHNRLRYYRNLLNFQGSISIISLQDMIENTGDALKNLIYYIAEQIKNILEITQDEEMKNKFSVLVKSMKINMNTKKLLKTVPFPTLKKFILSSEKDIEFDYKKQYASFNDKAVDAACKYAATNLMLKFTGLETKFFPDSIRATIHPKNGQFSLTTSSGGYPWNGVAYSEKWPKSVEQIKIVPFYKLCQNDKVRQIIFKTTGLPCCFTSSPKNPNIENARAVFPMTNILGNFEEFDSEEFESIRKLKYRAFTDTDLEEFCSLGVGDASYTWENEVKNKEYFSTLLRFRLNHYESFGFGVYALLDENNKMIGQFGLQVMDSMEKDEVEVVIYLSKKYRGIGIGTALFKAARKKSIELKLRHLYASIRTDDEICKRALEKACNKNITFVRTQIYFHKIALIYRMY